jgi:riboflavin biosynthesis pyrimidine reductase
VTLTQVFPETGGQPDISSAYAWPDRGAWVRAMMVMSLDGAISGSDGRSGSISSATDRLIMKQVRSFSDVVLIGASTMRAEKYSPMKVIPEILDERRSQGLDDASVTAIVSASLDLPWELPAFSESYRQPIVITTTDCDEATAIEASKHCELIRVTDIKNNPGAIIDALTAMGLNRIICEGGARLLGDLTKAGCIDEFDVAISPTLANNGQALLHANFDAPQRLTLAHVLQDEGFLFTRYLRAESATSA